MNERRLELAVEACSTERLDAMANNQRITKEILLAELCRVGQLLRGEPVYDYHNQKWLD